MQIVKLSLLFLLSLDGCHTQADKPCQADEECPGRLVCNQGQCETARPTGRMKYEETDRQEAMVGFRRVVEACQAAYEAYEKFEKEQERLAALAQKQAGLKAGQEATVEIDEGVEQLLLEYAIASENTLQEAIRVGVPLYDDNPFFRDAVRETLRATLPEGQAGPAVPFEIEFCDPTFLETLWSHVGEPDMPGME